MIAPEELNKYLTEFIRSVRRKDEDYEPSSLRCLVSSIERRLKKNDYPVSTFITHNARILFHKAHLYKSIRFILTCEKSLYSQSELRTAISHVEV